MTRVREGCSCGAYIDGKRRDVLEWRAQHTCSDRQVEETREHAGAQIENAALREVDGLEARIGFQREPW